MITRCRWALIAALLANFLAGVHGRYQYSTMGYEILVEGRHKLPESEYHKLYYQVNKAPDKNLIYKKPEVAKSLDCQRILLNDTRYIKSIERLNYVHDPYHLNTSCEAIKARNYFTPKAYTKEEEEFPLAFARAAYRDYLMLEMELAATYMPQNLYVYVLDKKSDVKFHERMHNLSRCFNNVFIMAKTYDMNSYGQNMNYALMDSLKFLSRDRFKWKYVMFLQNHDVQIKTNYELVQIFKFFNGTNDIEVNPPWDWLTQRIDPDLDWSFKGLKFFKNETRNTKSKINFAKGYASASLSRKMVEFMVNDLDLTQFLAQLENGRYGVDEQLLATLQADDQIGAPGGFTYKCVDEGHRADCATRAAFWTMDRPCLSGIHRHSVCIMGVEDLANIVKLPYLTINKFIPSVDFGALTCWHEHMFNRTHLYTPKRSTLNMSFYANLNHVRYNREKWLKKNFDPDEFQCRKDPVYKYGSFYQYYSYYKYWYFS